MAEEALNHETIRHEDAQRHHHHSHGPASRHAEGHHLLQVEDLTVSFLMYDTGQEGTASPARQEAGQEGTAPLSRGASRASFFRGRKREVPVISNLSISVHVGEVVAVVGASGAGKTLLADAIMGIFQPNALVSGRIWFDGEAQDAQSLARLRGKGISLVPQSTAYLDPLMRVADQVRGFRGDRASRSQAQRELFARYGLDEEAGRLRPFELSGGMARRVLLVSALIDQPKLIVADEPTVGLDLDLASRALADFRSFADSGKGVLLITHDIELALRVADRVAVFQGGTVVEETAVGSFASPDLLAHPFSKELWHALPEHDFTAPEYPSPGQGVPAAPQKTGASAPSEAADNGEAEGRGEAPC